MKWGILVLFISCLFFLQASTAATSNEPYHPPPNVEGIISQSRFTEQMREAVRRRVNENYRDDLLSDLEKNMKRMSDKEKLEAPAPQARTKQHQSPVVGKGMMRGTGARSTHVLVPFDYFMLARREMNTYEESVVKHIAAWLGVFRIGENAEFYFNRVLGLSQMAMNLSLTAAEKFDGFVDTWGNPLIPWYNDFTAKIICDLDFKQKDPDSDYGTIFNFPDYCVEDVQGAYFLANSTTEIQDRLYFTYNDIILDNRYNNIAMACVHPEGPNVMVHPHSYWYCFMYFVKLSQHITSHTCSCAAPQNSCCASGFGI